MNVNKAQYLYHFAIGEDVRRYLELMIKDRAERGELLELECWLFRSYSTRRGNNKIRKVRRSELGEPFSIAG